MNAQNIRPIRDNVGFCWNPDEMNTLMSYLAKNDTQKSFSSDNLVLGISPHDDYLYAGRVYYPLYKLIHAKEIVVFGVTHGTVRKAMNDPRNILIFDDYKYWHGPYKNIEVSLLREYIENKLPKNDFMVSDRAQDIEHSIEALLPFVQYYNHDFKFTPIMVTGMSFDRMDKISDKLADIISGYIKAHNLKLGKDVFFLISSDLNHYGKDFDNVPYGEDKKAHTEGTENDQRIAHAAFDGELTKDKIEHLTSELWQNPGSEKPHPIWCGQYSIPFGLLTTMKVINNVSEKKLDGEIFRYSDTWTEGVIPIKYTNLGTTAPFSLKHWVGFLSAGFYLK